MSSATIGNPLRMRGNWDEAAAAADATVIRVLTLNAHQGFSALRRRKVLSEIRDELRADDAHLVFLQEIGGAEGEEVSPHQYEVLADQVWPQHAYGRNAVTTGGHHGNALLSKYSIVEWQNVDASVGESEPRGMLHCVLDIPRAPQLHAVCVHFGLRESHRQRQIEFLLDLVARHDSERRAAGDRRGLQRLARARASAAAA